MTVCVTVLREGRIQGRKEGFGMSGIMKVIHYRTFCSQHRGDLIRALTNVVIKIVLSIELIL